MNARILESSRRSRLVMFAGFDGRSYEAIAEPRKNGVMRLDYFVTLRDGRSEHVTAYLDRHDAKARVAELARGA